MFGGVKKLIILVVAATGMITGLDSMMKFVTGNVLKAVLKAVP